MNTEMKNRKERLMNEPMNPFAALAQRARAGDEQARRQFVREIEPYLARMVKHSARLKSAAHGPLGQIQAVVRRLTGPSARDADPDALAHDLGRIIAAQLWSGPTQTCAPTLA